MSYCCCRTQKLVESCSAARSDWSLFQVLKHSTTWRRKITKLVSTWRISMEIAGQLTTLTLELMTHLKTTRFKWVKHITPLCKWGEKYSLVRCQNNLFTPLTFQNWPSVVDSAQCHGTEISADCCWAVILLSFDTMKQQREGSYETGYDFGRVPIWGVRRDMNIPAQVSYWCCAGGMLVVVHSWCSCASISTSVAPVLHRCSTAVPKTLWSKA